MKRILIFSLLAFSIDVFSSSRIISAVPSFTDTIFYFGAGEKLVGISNFCKLPKAKLLPKIGSSLNLDLESIKRINPDIVLFGMNKSEKIIKLKKLGVKTVSIGHNSLDEIKESFLTISKIVNMPKKGKALVSEINKELSKKITNKNVLIVIGHSENGGNFSDFYVAGAGTYFSQILNKLGAKNPIKTKGFKQISLEDLLRLRVDIIVDLLPGMIKDGQRKKFKELWNKIIILKKMNTKVVDIFGDYAVIPGPQILRLIKELKGKITK